jgi:hypothetical protein
VNTDIIEKIPIVIPNKERKVRNLLTYIELIANRIPSLNNLRNIPDFFKQRVKDKKIPKCLEIIPLIMC